MPIACVKCRRLMKPKKNGLGLRWGESHIRAGDLYECPDCGIEIIDAVEGSGYDPDNTVETIQMLSTT